MDYNRLCLAIWCVFVSGALHAQETKSAVQPKENAPTASQKPTVVSPSKTITPLTIEQIRANLPTTSADRFEFLRNQRKITLDAIDEASSDLIKVAARTDLVQATKTSIEERGYVARVEIPKSTLQAELDRAKQGLATAQKAVAKEKARRSPSNEELERLDMESVRWKSSVAQLQDHIESYDQRRKDDEKKKQDDENAMKAATDELSGLTTQREQLLQAQLSYRRLLGQIDDMVNQLFIASDATNSFKLKMSIAFAILVAIVILGFFAVAWSNEDIKKTIFSNESGIQFITMFAIVISVILFGIIGILEGKELSALLGGLSGYILGKSRSQ